MRKRNINREAPMDYREGRLTVREKMIFATAYALLCGVIAYLFYRSVLAFVLLLPGIVLFRPAVRKAMISRRREELRVQFLAGMQLVCTALRAGYAIENAFREAVKELPGIYGTSSPIVREFSLIVAQNALNCPIETLLLDLGERSGVEDIRSFAEVFVIARRTGGDLLQISTNTITAMERKEETASEIRTLLAGKEMEHLIMSLSPLLILGYIDLTSPDFLTPMYGNTLGITVMTFCLMIYAIAFLWGRKILDIQV